MAAERPGLIVLDIGILMGSRSPQVFMEMVDLYPGARKVLDAIESIPCECADPLCSQKTFQIFLNCGCDHKPDLAAKLMQEVDEAGPLTYESLRTLQHDFFSRQVSVHYITSEHLFGSDIPLVAIPPVEPEAPADNLDHDEPEHGRPQEE